MDNDLYYDYYWSTGCCQDYSIVLRVIADCDYNEYESNGDYYDSCGYYADHDGWLRGSDAVNSF